ncbi:MAG: hypothetical protein AB8B72_10205 [Crocinitomicaceae bacterium]
MKFIIVLFILGITASISAQTKTEKYYFRSSEKIVKFNISDVFSQIPAFGIEVESKFKEKSSFLFETSIIPSFFQPLVGSQNSSGFNGFSAFNNNGFDYLRGYQLGAGARFYAFKKPTRYVSFGANFRHLIIRDRDVLFGIDPIANNNGWGPQEFAFQQIADMLFHQFRMSWVARLGFQRDVGTHFVFDCNIGVRLETTAVQSQSETPENGVRIRNWGTRLYLEDNYRNTTMMPVLGLKIGYKL